MLILVHHYHYEHDHDHDHVDHVDHVDHDHDHADHDHDHADHDHVDHNHDHVDHNHVDHVDHDHDHVNHGQVKCRATAGNGLYTSDTIVEAPVRCKTLIRAKIWWLQNFHPQFQYQKPLPMDKMFMLANIKLDAYF